MSRIEFDNQGREKRMSKDGFFVTPIYFTDLIEAATLNEQLKNNIRHWRQQDPQGTVRSNVSRIRRLYILASVCEMDPIITRTARLRTIAHTATS